MKISRIACVAVSLGLLGAGTAFATDDAADADVTTQTINVFYPDLNLTKSQDARVLFMRLENAAKDICGDAFETPYLSERANVEQCQKNAIANAVVKIDQPRLTAVYDKHYDIRRGQS
jgi:UrcA family protein